ncbi:unnamed protein product [Protopolystoma xenopodis]|uniref:Uncharacterized protein n=1 Tax=Protopolystoma xenopodis TaxID=117903 RepID=A0A3S5AHJ5_9PLAT|nr:unnamed protein product [Protopolystoma xenopodis]
MAGWLGRIHSPDSLGTHSVGVHCTKSTDLARRFAGTRLVPPGGRAEACRLVAGQTTNGRANWPTPTGATDWPPTGSMGRSLRRLTWQPEPGCRATAHRHRSAHCRGPESGSSQATGCTQTVTREGLLLCLLLQVVRPGRGKTRRNWAHGSQAMWPCSGPKVGERMVHVCPVAWRWRRTLRWCCWYRLPVAGPSARLNNTSDPLEAGLVQEKPTE